MKTKRSGRAPAKYCAAVRAIVDHLERTQLPSIERAADMVVAALRNKGCVLCSGIGHGNEGDFLSRAGGLAAVQRFSFGLSAAAPMAGSLKKLRCRDGKEALREAETVRLALRTARLRAGDVMLMSSVSGRNAPPIELALACREIGVRTVGLTSMAYTARVSPLHPSGRKLCEVVDVAIDCGAPYGDAAVKIRGLSVPALPVSGVGMIVAGWMLWGRVMEKMAAAGDPPSVFLSVNRDGGNKAYEKTTKRYQKRGY